MIITRRPAAQSRSEVAATDLPSYYSRARGFLVAAAIDRYVYLTLHQNIRRRVHQSSIQRWKRVTSIDDIRPSDHSRRHCASTGTPWRVRSKLRACRIFQPGAGSAPSGSFTTALLGALSRPQSRDRCRNHVSPKRRCHIELDVLGEPIREGRISFIAAYGKRNRRFFVQPGTITVYGRNQLATHPLKIARQFSKIISSCSLRGYTRSAFQHSQKIKTGADPKSKRFAAMIDNLHRVKGTWAGNKSAERARRRAKHPCADFAGLMHEHWEGSSDGGGEMSNDRNRRIGTGWGAKNGGAPAGKADRGPGGKAAFLNVLHRRDKDANCATPMAGGAGGGLAGKFFWGRGGPQFFRFFNRGFWHRGGNPGGFPREILLKG